VKKKMKPKRTKTIGSQMDENYSYEVFIGKLKIGDRVWTECGKATVTAILQTPQANGADGFAEVTLDPTAVDWIDEKGRERCDTKGWTAAHAVLRVNFRHHMDRFPAEAKRLRKLADALWDSEWAARAKRSGNRGNRGKVVHMGGGR